MITGQDAHTTHKWFADQAKPPMFFITALDKDYYAVLADNW
jgi:hypothetical protein